MKTLKYYYKRLMYVFSAIAIIFVLFCNVANASTLSNTFSNIFSFINTKVIGQIKQDFCKQYILSLSTGDWKEGEFRANLGKKYCASFTTHSNPNEKISSAILQNLNTNSNVFVPSQLNTPSINNPTPDVYIPSVNPSVDSLNSNQIISLTNTQRSIIDSSLIDLEYNSLLKKIAEIRVRDMFAGQYFEHNSPSGDNASKEASRNGYSYITIGENIALGNFNGSVGVVDAWMNSPGHRANILNKNYSEIGVFTMSGIYNGQNVWIAAQIFAKPMADCAAPDIVLMEKISQYKYSANSLLNNINNIDVELKNININDNQVYNNKVAERNTLAGLYNNLASEIKARVAEYNKEVSLYNTCIKL